MITKLRAAADEESGFTLVELLIVIAILGILAGVVVFSVAGITDDGTTSACKTEVSTVRTAGEAYYAKTSPHAYPTDMDDLTTGTAKLLGSKPELVKLDATNSATNFVLAWKSAKCGAVDTIIT